LTNEAFLIADQTVAGYVQGVYTKDELQESLRYYSDKLNASICHYFCSVIDKHASCDVGGIEDDKSKTNRKNNQKTYEYFIKQRVA